MVDLRRSRSTLKRNKYQETPAKQAIREIIKPQQATVSQMLNIYGDLPERDYIDSFSASKLIV